MFYRFSAGGWIVWCSFFATPGAIVPVRSSSMLKECQILVEILPMTDWRPIVVTMCSHCAGSELVVLHVKNKPHCNYFFNYRSILIKIYLAHKVREFRWTLKTKWKRNWLKNVMQGYNGIAVEATLKQRWNNVETTLKQRWNNVKTTLKQR